MDRLDYVYVVAVSNGYTVSRFRFVGCFIIIFVVVVVVVVVIVFKLLFGWGAGEKFVWLLWFVVYYDW